MFQDPQDRSGAPREDSGGEPSRGGAELEVDAGAHHFVQGAEREASAREGCVDGGDAEGEALGGLAGAVAFDPNDSGA